MGPPQQPIGGHRLEVAPDGHLRGGQLLGELPQRHDAARLDLLEDVAAPLFDQHDLIVHSDQLCTIIRSTSRELVQSGGGRPRPALGQLP